MQRAAGGTSCEVAGHGSGERMRSDGARRTKDEAARREAVQERLRPVRCAVSACAAIAAPLRFVASHCTHPKRGVLA